MSKLDRLVAELVMGFKVIPAKECDPNINAETLAGRLMLMACPVAVMREVCDGSIAKHGDIGMCGEVMYEAFVLWINNVGIESAQWRSGYADKGRIEHPEGVYEWSPSTSIAEAWEVVEHLRKQTKDDGTRKYLVSIVDDIAHVEVIVETVCREAYHSWSVPHGKEPQAICVAALLAVGVDEATIQEAMR
jgi:hypothetical protein